jgi:ElaB/YqjD/DUF883 family membrane-anchored ribosome-binding protein
MEERAIHERQRRKQQQLEQKEQTKVDQKLDQVLSYLENLHTANPAQSITGTLPKEINSKLDQLLHHLQTAKPTEVRESVSNQDIQNILKLLQNSNKGTASAQEVACTTVRVDELERKFLPYADVKNSYNLLKAAHALPSAKLAKNILNEELKRLEAISTVDMKPVPTARLKNDISDIEAAIENFSDATGARSSDFYRSTKQKITQALKLHSDFSTNEVIKTTCKQHECFDNSKIIDDTCAALHYHLTGDILVHYP